VETAVLVATTITYNVVEAIVALTAGTLAFSTALIGLGLDSVIKVSCAVAVAWQFSAPDHATRVGRERRTLRIIAVSSSRSPRTSPSTPSAPRPDPAKPNTRCPASCT
jgi:hypothetical protein